MPKVLADLCIALHEAGDLAPDEPLCAPAMHQVRLWNLWGSGKYLIRRVTNQADKTEYVARRQDVSGAPLLRFRWSPRQDISEVVAYLRKGEFARIIFVDERGQLVTSSREWHRALYISISGRAYWQARDGIGAEFFAEEFKRIQHLSWRAKTSDAEIARHIWHMLADEDSDCAFAWRWVGLNQQEQNELIFRVQQGTREECDNLLRSIVWTDSSLDPSKTWEWSIGLTIESKLAEGQWSSRNTELECENADYPLNPRQARLLELVVHHLGLHISSQVTIYKVVRYWFDYGDGDIFRVSASPCSQHERFEAHFQLRDWLRGKVSAEEMDSLLSQGVE